jgi:hypothetical protein
MVESVILLLIYICLVAAVVWLVIWVLDQIGFPIPPQIQKILWVVAVLIVLLLLWRTFGGALRI